jgi:hypothetical protein
MQDLGDKVILDFENKDALAEYFSRKEPGEKCRLVLDVSVDELSDKQGKFSIDKIKIDKLPDGESMSDAEDANEEGDSNAGDETQPVLEWAKSNMSDNVPAENSMGAGY